MPGRLWCQTTTFYTTSTFSVCVESVRLSR